METVNEIEDSPKSTTENVRLDPVEEERLKMKLRMQQAAAGTPNSNTANDESNISNENNAVQSRPRGVRRLKSASLTNAGTVRRSGSFNIAGQRVSSAGNGNNFRVPERARSLRMNDLRPLAPTKSTDVAASMRGNTIQRNRVLMRASSSSAGVPRPRLGGSAAPPSRGVSASYSGGLRPYTPGQIVNTQIERKSGGRMIGPGGTLQRTISDCSAGSFDDTMHSMVSGGDFSLYTMDSIHLRKGQQVIADPLDDKTYLYGAEDESSFADHETYVTRMTGDDFDMFDTAALGIKETSRENEVLTFGPDSKQFTDRLHTMGITENLANGDDQSMASGLTNDFTDFGFEDEYDEYEEYGEEGEHHGEVSDDAVEDEEFDDESDDHHHQPDGVKQLPKAE